MIYFDNAATTKPHKDVLDSFNKVNETVYFNPNSPHKGVASGEGASTSKGTYIINAIYRTKTDVIFTSGATESNNIALKGIAYRKKQFANEIITSVLEHPSVLEVEIFRRRWVCIKIC